MRTMRSHMHRRTVGFVVVAALLSLATGQPRAAPNPSQPFAEA